MIRLCSNSSGVGWKVVFFHLRGALGFDFAVTVIKVPTVIVRGSELEIKKIPDNQRLGFLCPTVQIKVREEFLCERLPWERVNMQLLIDVIKRDPALLTVQVNSYNPRPRAEVQDWVRRVMNMIIKALFSYGKESIFFCHSNPPYSVYSFLGNTHVPVVSHAHLDFPVVPARGEALRPQHHGAVKPPKVIGRRRARRSGVFQTFPKFSHHETLAGSDGVKGDCL